MSEEVSRNAPDEEMEEQKTSPEVTEEEAPCEESIEIPIGDGDAPEEGSDISDEEEETDEKTASKIRNPFARRDKKELAKKEAELKELRDRYMRTLAEYENFRKRTEKEKADIYSFAVRDVMNKILPVLDNLERGVAAVPEDQKDDPFAAGMDKILKQFVKALDDVGVKPIEAAGKDFNPDLHNAVMHVEDETLGTNVVAEELLKGYTYRDTVVRHSMVKVAN